MHGRIAGIQVLRAIAAMLVAVGHFCLTTWNYGGGQYPGWLFALANFGQAGVDLFFCISGFVLLGVTQSSRDRFRLPDFLVRRVIRIVPLYWVATSMIVCMALASAAAKHGLNAALAAPLFAPEFLLKSYLFWPVTNPSDGSIMPFLEQGWTLSYEFYFYLLLGLIAWRIRSAAMGLLLLSALMAAACILAGHYAGTGAVGQFLQNRVVIEFLMGAGVYVVTRRNVTRGGLPIMLLGFILLIFGRDLLPMTASREVYWGIPSALILYGIVASEWRLRYSASLVLLGDASYSLYLTHGFVTYAYGALLRRGLLGPPPAGYLAIVLGTAISIMLAILCYRLVEAPLQKRLLDAYRSPSRRNVTAADHTTASIAAGVTKGDARLDVPVGD